MQWSALEPLTVRLPVKAGDTIKLNLLTVDGERTLDVMVGDRLGGSVGVDSRWRRFELTARSAGDRLRLVPRDDGRGSIHCSNISVSNVVKYGSGLLDWAVVRDVRLGPRTGEYARVVVPLIAVVVVFLAVALWWQIARRLLAFGRGRGSGSAGTGHHGDGGAGLFRCPLALQCGGFLADPDCDSAHSGGRNPNMARAGAGGAARNGCLAVDAGTDEPVPR